MMYHKPICSLLMPLSFGACKRGAKGKESQNHTKTGKDCMLLLLDQIELQLQGFKTAFL